MLKTHQFSRAYLILPLAALFVALIISLLPSSPVVLAAPSSQTLPTAEPCAPAALEPTSSVVNARTGPGPNYAITAELFEGQAYPVAGRHHGFRWWAVTLPDGRAGWVWNNIVTVSGNLDTVPLLDAPPLNGIIPDTEDNWTPVSASAPCQPQPEPTADPIPAPRNVLASQDGVNQTEGEWSAPANLSNSGGAANPSMVVNNQGRFDIFWDDVFVGNFLVEGNHTSWSEPLSVTVPFSGTVPLLLENSSQSTAAFWHDQEEDTLRFSSAADTELTGDEAWTAPQDLDNTILAYDAVVDGNGLLHLIYARSTLTASRSAGVYYTRSENQGATWSEPTLLYESSYFRSLRVEDVSVTLESVTEGGNVFLYAGWDVRNRKRLYFMRSTNAGQSWDTVSEVAGPESSSNIILPFNLQIGAGDSNVLLVWQVGQPGASCQQFYQWSMDHGANWEPRQQLDDPLAGTASCARENDILVGSDLFYLLTSFPEQVFLLAWNGERWSEPRAQQVLTQFNNPETLNTVNLGCKQTAVTGENRLYVVGCDTIALATSQGDIWFLSRMLGTSADWFPSAEEWSRATTIVEGPSIAHYPQLIGDNTMLIHAIWAQTDMEAGVLTNIYHSQWDRTSWTQPTHIVNSPAPISGLIAAARTAAERVYLLWTTTTGDVYLSQADAGQLQASTNWAPPEALPLDTATAGAPTIAVGTTGTIYVAYAQSINEQRGIYLIQSDDDGRTWSQSDLLFDGQATGWEIVGAPNLTVADDDTLHLTFDERQWTVDSSSTSTGLYYMQCAERGTDCSRPQMFAEGETLWNEIVTIDRSTIHRLWQGRNDDGLALQHQVSTDGGASWSRTNTLATGANIASNGDLTVTAEPEGRLFAFATTGNVLQSWIWENSVWTSDQTLAREISAAIEHELAATISQRGDLVVTFTDERPFPLVAPEEPIETDDTIEYALLAVDRLINPSAPSPTATVTIEPTGDAPVHATTVATPDQSPVNATETIEPELTPSPAVVLPPETDEESSTSIPFLDSTNPISFLLLSLVPVVALVLVALVIGGLRRNRQRRR